MSGPGFSLFGQTYLPAPRGYVYDPGFTPSPAYVSGLNGWSEENAVHGVVGGISYGTAGGPVTNLCGGLIFDTEAFHLPSVPGLYNVSVPTGLSTFQIRSWGAFLGVALLTTRPSSWMCPGWLPSRI